MKINEYILDLNEKRKHQDMDGAGMEDMHMDAAIHEDGDIVDPNAYLERYRRNNGNAASIIDAPVDPSSTPNEIYFEDDNDI